MQPRHSQLDPSAGSAPPTPHDLLQGPGEWRLARRSLALRRRPVLMGILNVTPDSFSEGGTFFDRSQAIDHAQRLVDQGADILDIGGESTRPYSTPVDARE